MFKGNLQAKQKWALLALVVASASTFRTTTAANAFGCLLDNNLCSEFETCLDDGIFGVCQRSDDQVEAEVLSALNSRLIEAELSNLWRDGYRLEDEYTQCVIGCMLDAARKGALYDPGCCTHALKLTMPVINAKVAAELSNTDPNDQASIRYTPGFPIEERVRLAGNDGDTFADEVFVPPVSTVVDGGSRDPEKELRRLDSLSEKKTTHNAVPSDQAGKLDLRISENENGDVGSREETDEEEDNRFARDIQDNLWKGNSQRYDDILPLVEDAIVDYGDIELPVEKRSVDAGQFDDALLDENLEQLSDGDLADLESSLQQEADKMLDGDDTEPSSMFNDDAYFIQSPDNSDFVRGLRIRTDPFVRPMRFDTKKPGPGYFIRERDENEDEKDYQAYVRKLKARMDTVPATSQLVYDADYLERAANAFDRNGMKRDVEEVRVPPSNLDLRFAKGIQQTLDPYTTEEGVQAVDSSRGYLIIDTSQRSTDGRLDVSKLQTTLEKLFGLSTGTIGDVRLEGTEYSFKLQPNNLKLNASELVRRIEEFSDQIRDKTNITIITGGIGEKIKQEIMTPRGGDLFLFTFVVCGSVVGVLLAISVIYVIRRHQLSKEKLHGLNGEDDPLTKYDYQDLCRQRMADTGKDSPLASAMESGKLQGSPKRVKIVSQRSDSSRSSTSSWSEEPVASNMDISTGHMILSYMEDHIKSKNRLDEEWESLCSYEADPSITSQAEKEENAKKNRFTDILPYDHSRVVLSDANSSAGLDYINASAITDHDPRNPAYIATQGPLADTASEFWQMVWEQGSVVIVTLTRIMENGVAMCHRYWPEEGSETYSQYEVHLVSEHVWCDDYLVRSFYLKNLKTSETRTVTQFHFLSWPDNGIPPSAKALLDFRRKVNKSYRGRSCPIVVHCSDGSGRTGTYILIDMVLNRIAKGAKEIDVAATLEHMRDQRCKLVKTKGQFEFVLTAIAEEVHAILKALSKE